MREIPLTQGMSALIDDDDLAKLGNVKWYAKRGKSNYYAVRETRAYGCRRQEFMHRTIMGDIPSDMDVDHIDGNGLNNQKSNLRLATKRQNSLNQKTPKNNTSGRKGVYFSKSPRVMKWVAFIRDNGKRVLHLGCFENYNDAVMAREAAEAKYYGQFANNR